MTKAHRFVTLAAALAVGTCVSATSFAQDSPGGTSPGGSSGSINTGGTGGTGGAADRSSTGMQRGGGQREIMQALQAANDPDKFFIVCAAIDNTFQTQLAQLAEQKAQDPQVKQIAQRMMQDHQQANQQLQQTAQGLGVQVPQGLPMMKQHELQLFQQLSGQEFDKEYISCLKAGHAMDVSRFQDVAQTAKNEQVKQYAQQMLPKLQEHAQQVQQAAVAVGLPSGNEAMTAGGRMSGSSSSPGRTSSQTGGTSGSSSSGTSGSSGTGGSSGTSGSSGSSGTSGGPR